jgi:hypothetical protein
MTVMPRRLSLAALACALALPLAAEAQMMGGMHDRMHAMMHGADGTGHDEMTMPGLRGLDATETESAELATMFRGFETMTRTVENLPDGIRTTTSSSDPEVMAALVSHVVGMIARVEEGRDPQVFIQSPTLDMFFVHGDRLVNDIQVTDAGIVVTQTTDDPEMATLLQIHAAEVSDMAARGMEAVHERMMGGN